MTVAVCVAPAVVGDVKPVTVKDAAAPGFTVNELLVPDLEEPDVLIVMLPECVTDTEPVHTPAAKAVVLAGLIEPEDALNVFVET